MSISTILIYLLNFIFIVVILDIILYKPVSKYLQKRSERIRSDLDQAEQSKVQAQLLQNQLSEKLKASDQIANQTLEDARSQASAEAKQILDHAREEADGIMVQMHKQMEQERKASIQRMNDELAQVSIALAEKILEREVKQEDNQAIIDAFFKEVG